MSTATVSRVMVGSEAVYLHRLLTDAESAAAARQVLRPSTDFRAKCWHTGPDLSTIGTPLYRTRDRLEYYTEQARATNALMYDTYRWLYDRVADYFEDLYSHPVEFVDGLAIPGFHLMAYGGAGRFKGGGWHLDQLAQQVPYFADRAAAIEGIVNFTLPLAVPGGGTGMDLRADQDESMVHVPYRPGVVLFTDRELLHRIGASVSNGPTDCRLTLQGHGVRYRRQLLLFW
jgi:hypothetical protein